MSGGAIVWAAAASRGAEGRVMNFSAEGLNLLQSTWRVALDGAPWLLLGLVVAGVIRAWVPAAVILRLLGRGRFGAVLKASLVGAPLPLCSCGVLPAAVALHRQGAPRGAVVAFLIATPETGVDSISISYALLGPFLMVARPLAAIVSAIVAGLLAELVVAAPPLPVALDAARNGAGACCHDGCCDEETSPQALGAPAGSWSKLRDGLRYALTDLFDDMAGWLAAGVLIAGAVSAWIPPDRLASWGSGLPAMLVMLLVGLPMYICATASTPLAAALLAAGVSPGTTLVFLLAGPATNFATMAVVRRELGTAVLLAYLAGISISAVTLGLLTDMIVARWGLDVRGQVLTYAEVVPPWLAVAALAALIFLAIKPLRRIVLGPPASGPLERVGEKAA